MTIAKAGVPLAAAALHGVAGGYTPVLVFVALACAVAAAALTAAGSGNAKDPTQPATDRGRRFGP